MLESAKMLLSFCCYITRVPFFQHPATFRPFPPSSPGSLLRGGQVSDDSVLRNLWVFISTLHRPSSCFLLCCPQRQWHICDWLGKQPTSKLRSFGTIMHCLSNHLRNPMTQRAAEMAQRENCLLSKHENCLWMLPTYIKAEAVECNLYSKCWRKQGGHCDWNNKAPPPFSVKDFESKTKPMAPNCIILHNFYVSGFWRCFSA